MRGSRRRSRNRRRAGLGALALLMVATASVSAAAAGEPAPVGHEPAGVSWGEGVRYELEVDASAPLRDLLAAEGFDITGYDLARDRVYVLTGAAGRARLDELGVSYRVLAVREGPRPLGGGEAGVDVPISDQRYADPAEIEAFLQQVAADHPLITRLVALGTSVEGRTIWGMLVSDNAAVDEDELAILFSGQHHAREVMTPEIVMDTIDQLTDGYGVDPELTPLVDAYQIWLVPSVNPDGANIVFTSDQDWRKNARDNDQNGVLDFRDGVDLNRNYEWGWENQCGGSSSSGTSQVYRGPAEASEPETQAMIRLGRAIRPVFDVEYHSFGEDVFYALSCDPTFSPTLSTIVGGGDQSISRVIAEDYAARIIQADGQPGYTPAPFGSRVDGTGRDQQYYENGAIGFVTEVNSSAEGGFRPDYGTYRDPTVEGHRPAWKWLIQRIGGPAVGGHVVDAVTGAPVEARVTLDEMTLPAGQVITSRPDTGRFHIIVVPGEYTLRATAPGYADAAMAVSVGSTFVPVTVELVPLGATRIAAYDFEDPAQVAEWIAGAPGDDAVAGQWVWGEPVGTQEGAIQTTLRWGNARFDATPGEAHLAWVTGNQTGVSIGAQDVDGGVTSLISPAFDLSAFYAVELAWQRWFRKEASDPLDAYEVSVSTDGGASWASLDLLAATTGPSDDRPRWEGARVRLDDVAAPGPDVRFRFQVRDLAGDDLVEGGLDEVVLTGFDRATQGEVRGVALSGGADTELSWQAVPGGDGAVYDVARGDLSALAGDASGVDLGALVCIEENSPDTSTAGDADSDLPLAGSGFFYVVRFELGLSVGEWGFGSEGGRRTGSGGCLP